MADYDRIGEGLILVSKEPLSYDWTPPELVGGGRASRASIVVSWHREP